MARKQPLKKLPFTREMIPSGLDQAQLLRDFRSSAWNELQELPFPTLKDEAWRRTSLVGLDLGTLQLANGKAGQTIPQIPASAILRDAVLSGNPRAILHGGGIEVKDTAGLEKQGVIFCSLTDAARDHPKLVEKVLGKIVQPEDGVFAAAAAAFSSQGIFLYVPKGVAVEQPLFGVIIAPAGPVAHFFQTLIYLEEGSSANYLQETLSLAGKEGASLTGENLEVHVGPAARLQIAELQNYGPEVWSFGHKKVRVERDGVLEWEIAALGSKLSKHFVSLDLVGTGAEGRVSGLFYADGEQHLTYNTLQRHLAPRTTSDLLFKGALNGSSRSVWRGMIYVAEGARYIDGYQANRNLMLDSEARSDSIPGLEILNNEVRCTHGSTIGKIDEEQLFYLLSRGIPHHEAEQLIIQGFFDDVISRFSIAAVGEAFWEEIQARLVN